ncbi:MULTISPECIES: AlpA family phage regulatory protein [Stutzerimonas]|uniref:AlpA family phage regulatory protein n=2 Tax=Pseudomonadaceae TaxID=135621 RepID=A0A2T5PT06_ECTOL|nr:MULTISPECIES: AlpA family phage regulatory protein [Pseudomonadaceae]MDH0156351.1 AlpA family phage regulatory protein [Stutzerimonas stutzeri]PTU80867.1 hypothetical protein DBO86_00730 [Pseudomonas indoloxydans]QWV15598.1 AlpA family phage regulatory protein [Stutzerimonas zhaodongensis]
MLVGYLCGLARSTIYKFIGSGEFPQFFPLARRSFDWIKI